MTEWRPRLDGVTGPIHQRIVAAMEADITSGLLPPEARLPTHRKLAEVLGVGLGTVTRAYADAEAKGLVTARVGRGSFVAARRSESHDGPIDLARNVPPAAHVHANLAETLSRLRRRPDLQAHLDYAPAAGFEAHRRTGATWLERTAQFQRLPWQRVICCAGAQQAITISLAAACRPGAALIVEAATFAGIKALAAQMDYVLTPAAMDTEGLLPEALDDAAARSGARVAYVQPLQNPTARIMGARRRQAIVAIARKRDIWLVEDDLYAAYASELGLPPLALLAPERVFYVSGLSKSVTPGLRLGYCVPPQGSEWLERCIGALRAIAFGPPGFSGLVATQWIEDGTAERILESHRREFEIRARLARNILGDAAEIPPNRATTHLWLPLGELDAERSAARALRDGVEVTPPSAPFVPGAQEHGLRVCLGGAPNRQILEEGLIRVRRALNAGGDDGLDSV